MSAQVTLPRWNGAPGVDIKLQMVIDARAEHFRTAANHATSGFVMRPALSASHTSYSSVPPTCDRRRRSQRGAQIPFSAAPSLSPAPALSRRTSPRSTSMPQSGLSL